MSFDYFLQDDKTKSLRRYVKGENSGQRWDREKQKWIDECAPRKACELTRDKPIPESQIAKHQ